jgi:hypothetical protein
MTDNARADQWELGKNPSMRDHGLNRSSLDRPEGLLQHSVQAYNKNGFGSL